MYRYPPVRKSCISYGLSDAADILTVYISSMNEISSIRIRNMTRGTQVYSSGLGFFHAPNLGCYPGTIES